MIMDFDDADDDAYTDIDVDLSGKPIIPAFRKTRPTPGPSDSTAVPRPAPRTPPATRPRAMSRPPAPLRKTASLYEKRSVELPLPPLPHQNQGSQRFRSSTFKEQQKPPPLPPKPQPQLDWNELLAEPNKPKRELSIKDFIVDSEQLKPSGFVGKYQDKFPLKVRVCKGFYGHSERTSVSEGDMFSVHFVKHTKVVHMLDGGGVTYKIPLNSALEFGIMYDPNQKRDEALNGFVFEKVSDLLAAESMPHAIRSGAAWRGFGANSTIESNELLVIKGIKRRLNSKILKVYSLATGKKKELPENCIGKFTTRPYDVRFFLSEIVEHMPDAIPCQSMLFVHSETASELPSHLVTAVVTLTETSVETSLVATTPDVEDFKDAAMFDIPLDLDIEFQVLHYKRQEDTEQLYSDTRTLLENYHPAKATQYSTSENVYSIAIVRKDNAFSGIDIIKPRTIYYNVHEQAEENIPKDTTSGPDKLAMEIIYEDTNSSSTKQKEHPRSPVEDTQQKLISTENSPANISRQITSARADMKRLESRTARVTEDVSNLKKQLAETAAAVQSMKEILTNVCEQVKSLTESKARQVSNTGYTQLRPSSAISTAQHREPNTDNGIYHVIPASAPSKVVTNERLSPVKATTSSPGQSQTSIPESVCEENRQFLGSLDHMQVQTLLELMGLKGYQEVFMAERVDGEMLLECDEDVLLNELKVKSKLRRVRLMKLISGRHSAEQILKGEDPYVYVAPS